MPSPGRDDWRDCNTRRYSKTRNKTAYEKEEIVENKAGLIEIAGAFS